MGGTARGENPAPRRAALLHAEDLNRGPVASSSFNGCRRICFFWRWPHPTGPPRDYPSLPVTAAPPAASGLIPQFSPELILSGGGVGEERQRKVMHRLRSHPPPSFSSLERGRASGFFLLLLLLLLLPDNYFFHGGAVNCCH